MGKKWNTVQYTSGKVENHKLSLGASEEVTYYINESGSDSASSPYSIYLDFERPAISVCIRATVVCSLTHWNGKALKSPVTLNAGANVLSSMCTNFKILSIASTVLEITVK